MAHRRLPMVIEAYIVACELPHGVFARFPSCLMEADVRVSCDQPRIARIQKPVPARAEQYVNTIAGTDEERDVNCPPQEPSNKATTLKAADLNSCSRLPLRRYKNGLVRLEKWRADHLPIAREWRRAP